MDDYEFTLCLTHDIDRIYKTYQGPYYALKRGELHHIADYLTSRRPYWQFETIMELEEDLGVRSSFYFLNEKRLFSDKSPREWLRPESWKLFAGRYDVTDEEVVDVIRKLDRGGWEVGLHGSYESYEDLERLRYEKEVLEEILGHEVLGGRQHYLNLERPTTWRYHREIGLRYDASVGSSSTYGFDHGYEPFHPFDDGFTVFPTTIMEIALMNANEGLEAAWQECLEILRQASEHDTVMTVLWHPCVFNERDFPGYREIYERLIRTAKEMGAWVGPVRDAYARLNADRERPSPG
ncbi:polysaccharide deacetylase family protein [Natrialbaceae archaeon A-gly3]